MARDVFNGKGKKYGKIGIAKADKVQYTINGIYEEDRQKFLSVVTNFGITFTDNLVNNNETVNKVNTNTGDIVSLDTRVSAHDTSLDTLSNKVGTNTNDIATLEASVTTNTDNIISLDSKLNAIASLLGITFTATGTITAETYSSHTHSYEDTTINDTADGTGVETSTTKTTEGVN